MIRKTAGGEQEEVAEESEEEEGEVRRPRKVLDPKDPSEEKRKEHELTHLPFRNWCRHCIRGRGEESHAGMSRGTAPRCLSYIWILCLWARRKAERH